MNGPSLRDFLTELKDASDMPMHHAADIDQFLTEADAAKPQITVDDLLAHEFQVTIPMRPEHPIKWHWHCRCGAMGTVDSSRLRARAHAEHVVEALSQSPSEAEQPGPAPVPRLVRCESEEALDALLQSLNDAGNIAEVACLSDPNGAPFIASLWDIDYAGAVHYLMTESDSGQAHCHYCAECRPKTGGHTYDCDYGKPAFPIIVVLTEDPIPASFLDGEVANWWSTA